MSTTVTGNPTAAASPSPVPTPGAIPVLTVPVDGDAGSGASILQAFTALANFNAWLMQSGPGGYLFGDGTHGNTDVSSGNLDLLAAIGPGQIAQEAHFRNLTIRAGRKVFARSTIIRVLDTLTIESGGFLMPDDLTLMAGGSFGTGSPGGVIWTATTGGFRSAGGGSSGAGTPPFPVTNSVGGAGGAGGVGSGGSTAQAAGGWSAATEGQYRKYMAGNGWAGGVGAWAAFQGGGGGGAGGGVIGYAGGGGGAGGPPLLVFARRLVYATAQAIQSMGGAGGMGALNGSGYGGGGGGGGGGFVGLVYGTKTGPSMFNNVLGGAAGAPAGGTAVAGAAGATGTFIESNLGV